MAEFVHVRNEKGQEKTMSLATWNLLRNKTSKGNTRKGWTLVGPAPQGKQGAPGTAKPQGPVASFLPAEISEANRAPHEAQVAKETAMIAGAPITSPPAPAQEAPAAPVKPAEEVAPVVPPVAQESVVAPAQEATTAPAQQEAKEAPEAKAPATNVKADDLASLPSLGTAVAAVLANIGITTYKQLVDASVADINKALDASKFAAKKAQVPTWRMKAAELIK